MKTGTLTTRTLRFRWIALCLVFALGLVGCGDQGDDTATGDEPTNGEATPDETDDADEEPDLTQGDEVELTFGHFVPPTHLLHREVAEYLAQELDERTGGRITLNIQPAGALGPPDAQYENIVAGAFDIGFGLHFYTPGRFPLQTVMEFPFLFRSAEQATEAYLQLYEDSPELQQEMQEVKVLGLWTHDLGELMSRTEPIQEPGDLQGMRIRSPGPLQNSLIEALGGSAVTTPAPEIYDTLDRGVVDGVMGAYSLVDSFNLHEIIGHVSKGGFYVATFFLAMNQESWDALSPQDQELFEELTGENVSLRAARAYDEHYDEADQRVMEADIEVYEFDEGDLEIWRDAAQGVVDEWIEEREAEGLPAREIHERLQQIVESNGGS